MRGDIKKIFFEVLSIFLLALIIIIALSLVTGPYYQCAWRIVFARRHIDVAQAVTDANSQYNEISKVKEILDSFPKEGNYDFLNKLNPNTDLKTAFLALSEIKNYTDTVRKMKRESSEYQLGIYNTQEKLQYFENTFFEAFEAYRDWGTLGGFLLFGKILLSLIFAFALIWNIMDTWDDKERIFWFIMGSIYLIVILATILSFLAPLFYSGPY